MLGSFGLAACLAQDSTSPGSSRGAPSAPPAPMTAPHGRPRRDEAATCSHVPPRRRISTKIQLRRNPPSPKFAHPLSLPTQAQALLLAKLIQFPTRTVLRRTSAFLLDSNSLRTQPAAPLSSPSPPATQTCIPTCACLPPSGPADGNAHRGTPSAAVTAVVIPAGYSSHPRPPRLNFIRSPRCPKDSSGISRVASASDSLHLHPLRLPHDSHTMCLLFFVPAIRLDAGKHRAGPRLLPRNRSCSSPVSGRRRHGHPWAFGKSLTSGPIPGSNAVVRRLFIAFGPEPARGPSNHHPVPSRRSPHPLNQLLRRALIASP